MADPPGPDSSLRPPSSPMGDDHDRSSDRVDQEPGGAQVIPGCDQPDLPRPETETDTGVRASPDIDGDDSSTSTSTNDKPPTESIRVQPGMSQQAQGSDAESISIMSMHPPLSGLSALEGYPARFSRASLEKQESTIKKPPAPKVNFSTTSHLTPQTLRCSQTTRQPARCCLRPARVPRGSRGEFGLSCGPESRHSPWRTCCRLG